MLKYNDFKDAIIKKIKDYIPNEYKNLDIETTKVNKVNESLDAIYLVDKSQKVSGSPVIYINTLYDCYMECENIELVLEKAASQIANGFNYSQNFTPINTENIKNNIVLVLINPENNEELFKTVPHKKFLDLAFIYRWIIRKDSTSFSGTIIPNEIAKMFNIDTDELFKIAKSNTIKIFPPKFQNIMDKIKPYIRPEDNIPNTNIPMFILSNRHCIEGAAYIAYDEILKSIRNKLGVNFYIIPSSINEVLIVPENTVDVGYLKYMLKGINSIFVKKCEKLSDNVYFYDGVVKIV